MTAPSFINGEWVIPESANENENPEVILLRQFELSKREREREKQRAKRRVYLISDFSQINLHPKKIVLF